MPSDLDPGSTIFFPLTIDGESLGYFNGCEGLSSEVEIEHHQEGGNNGFVWQLPTRVTFSNIRLTRPLTPDTAKVGKGVLSVQTGIKRPTPQLPAPRADGSLVARWGLIDVLPVSWQGPSLD